jgi:hypothetical protein
MKAIGLLALLFTLSGCYNGFSTKGSAATSLSSSAEPSALPNTFQFTETVASSDTRRIFISSSSGNDANDCLSEVTACQTQGRGLALLRSGYPDHLLFKRGDTFTGGLNGFAKSGRSASEPMVIGAYGSSGDRPYFRTGSGGFIFLLGSTSVRHLHILDLKLEANVHNPRDPSFSNTANGNTAISLLPSGSTFEDILIEGCDIGYYNVALVMHVAGVGAAINNIRIRGNNVHDSWSITGGPNHQGHSQGIYANNINGLLLEGNIFDHNGGLCTYPNDPRCIVPAGLTPVNVSGTWFNHQVYSDAENTNVIIINNIFANGDGVQMRGGGIAQNNIFVRTVSALSGGNDDGLADGRHFNFNFENNFFLEGTDFSDTGTTPGPRGFGISVTNVDSIGARIVNNVFLRDRSASSYGYAIHVGGGSRLGGGQTAIIRKAEVANNIIHNWRGGIQVAGTAGVHVFDTQISGNIVQSTRPDNTEAPVVSLASGGSAHLVLSANRYFSTLLNPFDCLGQRMQYPAWTSCAAEAGSSFARVSVTDENLNFQQVVLGSASADYEQAFARLRQQSRFNYDSSLEAVNLITRMRTILGDQ